MTASGDADPTELAPPGGSPSHALSGARQNLRAGHAGLASRFIAFVFDWAASTGVFLLVLEGASFAGNVLTGGSILWHGAACGWCSHSGAGSSSTTPNFWTTSGKTPGMTLLGVQVVGRDGSDVGSRRGLVRTLVFPLSFLLG